MPENMKFRYYLFGSDGVWRISTRMLSRMVLPQYAGTKQKTLDVHFWYEGGAIKTDIRPSVMAFDAEGRWDRAYSVQGGLAVLAAADITARAKRMTVADLGPVIDAKERMEAHRWKPTQAEIDRVMLDLLGGNHPRRRHIPYVKPAQLKEGKQNATAALVPATALSSSMKARQCAKIAELRQVLLRAGYPSIDKQASALGLSRSTTWAVLQANHKSSGLSGSVIKRMLRSRDLPPAARQWIEEYVVEKLAGTYGHGRKPLRIFRAQVDLQDGAAIGIPCAAQNLRDELS